MALVSQMFDTPDGCRHVSTAGRNHQVLRPRANRRSAGWRAGKYLRRQKVYRRLTKPCRDMGVDRVLIDLARRADLHQPSGLDHADTGSHGHRFGLIVGNIEDGRPEIGLDALKFKAHSPRSLASSDESGSSMR